MKACGEAGMSKDSQGPHSTPQRHTGPGEARPTYLPAASQALTG